jgi:DNA polymerase sigma
MPAYSEPHLEELLTEMFKMVSEIKEVVLDLQQRQKEMDARQQVIKHEIEDAPANQPIGSFATGYQKT